MAAVVPTNIRFEGTSTVFLGSGSNANAVNAWKHCKQYRATFADVDGTAPDTWSTRQVTAGTDGPRGFIIVKAAWDAYGATTADEGNIDWSTTAATATADAFDTVTFYGDADMDGDLIFWV